MKRLSLILIIMFIIISCDWNNPVDTEYDLGDLTGQLTLNRSENGVQKMFNLTWEKHSEAFGYRVEKALPMLTEENDYYTLSDCHEDTTFSDYIVVGDTLTNEFNTLYIYKVTGICDENQTNSLTNAWFPAISDFTVENITINSNNNSSESIQCCWNHSYICEESNGVNGYYEILYDDSTVPLANPQLGVNSVIIDNETIQDEMHDFKIRCVLVDSNHNEILYESEPDSVVTEYIPKFTIAGTVLDVDGNGVADAEVTLTISDKTNKSTTSQIKNKFGRAEITDENGTFTFFNYVDYGANILINVEKEGMFFPDTTITVIENKVIEIVQNEISTPGEPSNPSPLSGSSNISISGELTWNFGSNTETYNLLFGTEGNLEGVVANGAAEVTGSYYYEDISYGTTYCWQVISVNTNGVTLGAEWTFTTEEEPSAPGEPEYTSPDSNATNVSISTDLNWTNGEGTESVKLYFGAVVLPTNPLNLGDTETFTPNLTYETVYHWRVVCVNDNGETAGPEWIFTTEEEPSAPGEPEYTSPDSNATNVSISTDLNWTNGVGTESVKLYFGANQLPVTPILEGQATSYDPPENMEYNTEYHWQVVCVNDNGDTAGPEWTFTTEEEPSAPGEPEYTSPDSNATNVSISTDLNWTNGVGTESVKLYFASGSLPDDPIELENVETYQSGSNLEYNTEYHWQVVCVNDNGETSGEEWVFMTEAESSVPGEPVNISPETNATNVLVNTSLNWTNGAGTESVKLYFGSGNLPDDPIELGDVETYQPESDLDFSTEYHWQLVCVNAVGETSGEEWTFITEEEPSAPGEPEYTSPDSNATNVSISTDLNWTNGVGTESVKLYFGAGVLPTNPLNLGDIETFTPTLTYETVYHWRVVCVNDNGETAGPEWTFTTEEEVTYYTISGNVGVEAVVDLGSGNSSEEDGTYSISIEESEDITLTPVLDGWDFDPPTESYNDIHESIERNFIATIWMPGTPEGGEPSGGAVPTDVENIIWNVCSIGHEADYYSLVMATNENYNNPEIDESSISDTVFSLSNVEITSNTSYYVKVTPYINPPGASVPSQGESLEWSFMTQNGSRMFIDFGDSKNNRRKLDKD